MAHDRLFKELCSTEIMRIGWYLAQADSRDDFVTDPVGHADFASNLDDRLKHVVEQVENERYRPRHLLDIDIPKSGLSVRPGNVLPIEESSLLHAIVYLLAPLLDNKLSKSVYSYRLHPEWKKRIKKRDSLFRESGVEIPFLKKKTIRAITPFEAWYELWPEFEAESTAACTEEGYTHLTKTDISAYFENIDLHLLETQIRGLLKREENRVLHVAFRILEGWTRVTSAGTPVGRGIPQGNEIGSFFGNLYLVPLDRALTAFCKKHDAKWFRYVDDVKVFTKNQRDARAVVFVINETLRALHLNLQGSKTQILSGDELEADLDNAEINAVDQAFAAIQKLNPKDVKHKKAITSELKPLKPIVSRFRRGLPASVAKLNGKESRLFRRLLTTYGRCKRPHFRKAALAAMHQLPDLRILRKSLQYVTQLEYSTHQQTFNELMTLVESDELPFPYQVGVVFETIANLHPADPNPIASRIRKYAFGTNRHWFVIQRGLECISAYPYRHDYAESLAEKHLEFDDPIVRRASCVMLLRANKGRVRTRLQQLTYHADPSLSRLAIYFQRLVQDKPFALQELTRLRKGKSSDYAVLKSLPRLYALSATEDTQVAKETHEFVAKLSRSKSPKIDWHKAAIQSRTEWHLPPATVPYKDAV